MIKAYLDNNIFIDMEMGKLQAEQFLSKKGYAYYFSDAHMNELLEAKGNERVSQEGRVMLISKICGRNNILTGGYDKPEIFEKEPIEMYRLCDNPFRKYIAHQVNTDDGLFLEFRQRLGFESTVFNNESPKRVLEMIDERLKQKFEKLDLLTYLKATEAYGGKPLYHTLFNLIDAANYWGDKKTTHSNVARLYDAAHAYFAQVCNILVTDDKRMIAKAKAVYSFLGVKTKVLSVDEFFGDNYLA